MLKYLHDIITAFEAIIANKAKSLLTALGIVFGVAAVISMLAVGRGAQKEILDQIKLVGVNNIIVTPLKKNEKEKKEEVDKKASKKYSPGLTLKDADAIRKMIPDVKQVSTEINLDKFVLQNGIREPANLIGVDSGYFNLFNIQIAEGKFFDRLHMESGQPVCIIGNELKTKLFSNEDAVGQTVKCGKEWLTIIAVLEKRANINLSDKQVQNKDFNENIFIPVKTMLLRYVNRSLITQKSFEGSNGTTIVDDGEDFITTSYGAGAEERNKNQVDRIIIQVKESEDIIPVKDILDRILLRHHMGVRDFEISVPELLLKQQERTKDVFNIVLGAIAAISLLVGGIGIMNIMLASVLERTREIGIRQSMGATRKDIVFQFLAEAVFISVSGGIIGVILGVILSRLIMNISGVLTIITWYSVVLSFFISVAVGIIFGFVPARNASKKDPVESLRYE